MNDSRRAVIFDMDGTLTRAVLDFDQIRAEIGIVGDTILEAMSKMNPTDRHRAENIIARHEADAAANCCLQPHAEECVSALRRTGIPVALMTRNSRKSVETVLARHNLAFEHIRTREDGPFKPSPQPVFDICRELRCDPRDAWVVGDFRYDLECARAAGGTAVLLVESASNPDWADLAHHVIRDLLELLDLMRINRPSLASE